MLMHVESIAVVDSVAHWIQRRGTGVYRQWAGLSHCGYDVVARPFKSIIIYSSGRDKCLLFMPKGIRPANSCFLRFQERKCFRIPLYKIFGRAVYVLYHHAVVSQCDSIHPTGADNLGRWGIKDAWCVIKARSAADRARLVLAISSVIVVAPYRR